MKFNQLPHFIEIETGSYCNRVCTWCPNGWSKRGREKKYINKNIWEAIIENLAEYQYSGWLAFHNYNEPLLDPTIIEKIKFTNKNIPNAKTAIYTNGDYLDETFLNKLISLEVKEIRITLYPSISRKFEEPNNDKIIKFLESLNIKFNGEIIYGKRGKEAELQLKKTKLHLIVPNILDYTNRGGSVKISELNLKNIRTKPCFLPSHSAAIDYLGNLKLCCQIYNTKEEKNKNYIIGNIRDSSFTELWFSEKMTSFRQFSLNGDFAKMKPCHSCSHSLSINQEKNISL